MNAEPTTAPYLSLTDAGDEPRPDPLGMLETLITRVCRLPEYGMRKAVIHEFFEGADCADAAFVLDHLIRRTVTGHVDATETMLAVTAWLIRQEANQQLSSSSFSGTSSFPYELIRDIYGAASQEGRTCVAMLLLDLPPHRMVKLRKQGRVKFRTLDKELTLGERKQMARGSERRVIEALLKDPDPQVIHKLCQNPNVQEEDALLIATRRPNQPEILRALILHPRWFARYNIRHSLVLNPYSPTGLVLKLLPFLRGPDMQRVTLSGDLHPAIADTTRKLLAIRKTQRLKP